MLSAAVHIHRNILSAQCYIWYCNKFNAYSSLEVGCSSTELCISVLQDTASLHQCHIVLPQNLFRPLFVTSTPEKRLQHSLEAHTESSLNCTLLRNIDSSKEFNNDKVSAADLSVWAAKRLKLCSLCAYNNSSSGYWEPLNISLNEASRNSEQIGNQTFVLSAKKMCPHSGNLESHNSEWNHLQSIGVNSVVEPKHELSVAELSFRLQISNTDQLNLLLANSHPPSIVKDFMKQEIKVNAPYNVFCSHCDGILSTNSLHFQKVEECCEGLLSELSEGWFCHPEKVHTVNLPQQSLYFDSTSFYLHYSITEAFLLQKIEGLGYTCGNCGSLLAYESKALQNFTRFYCDKIGLRSLDSPLSSYSSYRFQMAWISLWSLIETNQKTSLNCKLYLHSKGLEGEICLLLWIPSEKVPQFLLHGSIPAYVDFKPEFVYKVLYHIGTPSSKIVQSWRHDFIVDFYKVSDSMMNIIIEYLKDSSKYVPGGQTTVNNLSQGCLPTQFPS